MNYLRYVVVLGLCLLFEATQAQQNPDFLTGSDAVLLKDQSYGPFDRNKFDIILPKSGTLTALVIFYHGGGFVHGDKSDGLRRKNEIKYFLDHNIAFATVNYRYRRNDDSLGVQVCIDDCKTFLQYIRHQAARYNIRKDLIGCYGSSAGAGTSLYLAFKDDMAVEGDTSLPGESTRIKCAGALSAQATYDIFRWMKYIPNLWLVSHYKSKLFYKEIANFYGYSTYKAFKPSKEKILKDLDMLGMIDPKDPPIYVMNLQKERFPKNFNIIEHHREHALILDKILKKNAVEHIVYIYGKKIKKTEDAKCSIGEFFVDHLKETTGIDTKYRAKD